MYIIDRETYTYTYIPAPSNRSPPATFKTFKSAKATGGDLLEGALLVCIYIVLDDMYTVYVYVYSICMLQYSIVYVYLIIGYSAC